VTAPLAPKLRSAWLAGDRFPLPETVVCTTPRVTATVRWLAPATASVPTLETATTMPAPMTTTSAIGTAARPGIGRRRMRAQLGFVADGVVLV
jgi:hypothetical protein